MELDKRAVRILMRTFWSASGWKINGSIAPDDFAYAKSKGVMFDPIRQSHDEAVQAAIGAAKKISKETVARAFVASLTSRRLELRSALGSFAIVRHMKFHSILRNTDRGPCSYCGDFDWVDIDRNILNFERLKWGGVRHSHPSYAAFDLQQFAAKSIAQPTGADFSILAEIFNVARQLPIKARLGDLDKALAKTFPSNSAERRTLIALLGYAGILIDRARPDFRLNFVAANQREHTPWHKDDWPYPVQWWTASCGVNEEAVQDWFPEAG